MPGPQKENGYTPIANEIMEAVARLQINATQFRILIVVWRYTYGFSRKQHKLSEGFIANATGIHKKRVGQELSVLIRRKIVTEVRPPSFSSSRIIAFNKHYKDWIEKEDDSQRKHRQSTETLTGNENIDETGSGSVDRGGSGSVDQDKQYLKQILKQKDKESNLKDLLYLSLKNLKELKDKKIYHGDYYKSYQETHPAFKVIEHFSKVSPEGKIGELVKIYLEVFPEQKKYGVAGQAKANDAFKETLEMPSCNEPEQILKEIVYAEGVSLSPWDIKDKFKNGGYKYSDMKYSIDEANERGSFNANQMQS